MSTASDRYEQDDLQKFLRDEKAKLEAKEQAREARRAVDPRWISLRADPEYQELQAQWRAAVAHRDLRRKLLSEKAEQELTESEREELGAANRLWYDHQSLLLRMKRLHDQYGAHDRIETVEDLIEELNTVDPDLTLQITRHRVPPMTDVFGEETLDWWRSAERLVQDDPSLPLLPLRPERGRDRHAALVHWCQSAVRIKQESSRQIACRQKDSAGRSLARAVLDGAARAATPNDHMAPILEPPEETQHLRGGNATTRESAAADVVRDSGNRKLVLSTERFTATYGGATSALKSGLEFRLLERLYRRPYTYVPIATLLQDVWGADEKRAKVTVQAAVAALRKKLRPLRGVKLDGKSHPGHYALILE